LAGNEAAVGVGRQPMSKVRIGLPKFRAIVCADAWSPDQAWQSSSTSSPSSR
jgi:hypothetical protein